MYAFKPKDRKIDLAILSAMTEELQFFKEYFEKVEFSIIKIDGFEFKIFNYKNISILLGQTGLGTTFAASMITMIHYCFKPDYILFSGTAGAINTSLKLCDVVIADKAFEAEIQGIFKLLKKTPFENSLIHPLKKMHFPTHFSADSELIDIALSCNKNANVYVGTVVSSNMFPAPKALFEKIKNKNTLSIDMETSAIYQIAWLLQLRVLVVRGISNILNQDGSDDKIHESDVTGSATAAAKVLLNVVDSLILKHNGFTSNHK